MKAKIIMVALTVFFLNASGFPMRDGQLETTNSSSDTVEIQKVKQVIVDAYVKGIFLEGNHKLVKEGWHSDCDIVILDKGQLKKLPINYWVQRLRKNPGPIDATVTFRFSDVEITGYAAMVIVEIYTQGRHLYTDYMCLYKFDKKWKIATKIFYTHPLK